MSARTLPTRRTVVLSALAVPALLLTPSAAVADPPALDRDPCSVHLARAAHWPGSLETPTGTSRLVSDAYVTHLSSQPPCTSGE